MVCRDEILAGPSSLKYSNHNCPVLYVKRVFIWKLIFVIGFNLGYKMDQEQPISHGVRTPDLIVGLYFCRRIHHYILEPKNWLDQRHLLEKVITDSPDNTNWFLHAKTVFKLRLNRQSCTVRFTFWKVKSILIAAIVYPVAVFTQISNQSSGL